MNTYRVTVQTKHMQEPRAYHVDAILPTVAAGRVLRDIKAPQCDVLEISCRLYARRVERDPWAPLVRAV